MGERIKISLEFEDSTKTVGKYLVFDIETTGLPIDRNAPPDDFKNWPYVVQIAWLLFDDDHKLIEHSDFYLKQSVQIPTEATNIHGITTAMMLEKGIEPLNAYANFKKAIDNTEYLISHNVDFDVPIVHCDFLRNGMQWDFPKNRILCTMKTGTGFCKIPPQRNGEYKWPTLTELYQKCFYPDYTMRIYSDATSDTKIHNANIDAAVTAKSFFKLKELGLFKELRMRTTANTLPPAQNEFNLENLHEYHEHIEDARGGEIRYVAEVKHLGLDTFRVLKDSEKYRLDNKRAAQFKKWDEQWAKLCYRRKTQADKEASLKTAEDQTREAQQRQKEIEDLLIHTLSVEDTVNWDSLKDTKNFEVPNPKSKLQSALKRIAPPARPKFEELPKQPAKGHYEPILSLVDKIFRSLKEKKIRQAETLYQKAMTSWQKSVDEIDSLNAKLKEEYEQKAKEFEERRQRVKERAAKLGNEWERAKETFHKNQQRYNEEIERLKDSYFHKSGEAVIQYCEMVLNNSQYPETFPKDFDLDYDSDNKLLIVEYVLPIPEDLPKLTGVKYIASKNELRESFLSETQLSRNYESVIYKVSLRTLHELFEADKAEALEAVIFNGWVSAINKGTGKKVSKCIVTIQARKTEFNEIELSNVDAKTCFKNLKGISTGKLSSLTAIQPIAQINRSDQRFTPSHEDANEVNQGEKNGTQLNVPVSISQLSQKLFP